MTGAQLKEYLEFSARYYVRTAPGAPVDLAALTNADGIPDYNYDALSGVTYEVDVAQPAGGSRIVGLAFEGEPVAADARFVLAVNNYRASGGGRVPARGRRREQCGRTRRRSGTRSSSGCGRRGRWNGGVRVGGVAADAGG